MIRLILNQLAAAKAATGLAWRQLCGPIAYSSLMRWRQRQRQGVELLRPPGPKKLESPDWQTLSAELAALPRGRSRTRGTTRFQERHHRCVSRRQARQLAAQIRRQQLDRMKRIHWHCPGLAWAIDATEYGRGPWKITPLQDLCSRYRFVPLITRTEDGRKVAAHLEAAFRAHGAPLLLKRDNGSPFNCEPVDALLARYRVLPLNSPPRYPRYNGSMEKSIGDLKRALQKKFPAPPRPEPKLLAQVEATVHDLNHRPRRCLNRRTACEVFHDPARRLRLSRKARLKIFRLLLQEFGSNIRNMPPRNQRELSALWRLSVESWLRRQGLISVRLNNPKQKVSTNFPKNWSHN